MLRRDFLKTAALAAAAVTSPAKAEESRLRARIHVEPFDYDGVRLRPSRWQKQFETARDFYLNVSEDDILHGWRAAASLPAPGRPLGGWCMNDSSTVFGQWLSGMSRVYRATGDTEMRDKAARLLSGWAKTVKPDGSCTMDHYPYDKLVCGLVDMHLYAGHPDAMPLLEKVTEWASRTFTRENLPAAAWPPEMHSGKPGEWYTLAENLYRAYIASGNPLYREFGNVWLHPVYWNKFAATSEAKDVWDVHAYSHVNTFSSAAMAYAVSGDPRYLAIIKNAYDFLQQTQCYSTGGFGPAERILPPDGSLGRALDLRIDCFETECGSWAGFKLSRYLIGFTGEARFGDWIERLFYNGMGASLPLGRGGKNFYYSDYRVAGGIKVYDEGTFTCCSGSLFQGLADYHNLIYFKDAGALYVNLYVPSEVSWRRPEGNVRIVQNTEYPEAETSTLRIESQRSEAFALKFRVPGWSRGMSAKLNGAAVQMEATPGAWATIARTWAPGDTVEIRIPLHFRMEAVDPQHPTRVAIVRGPVVFVMDAGRHEPVPALPDAEKLDAWLTLDQGPPVFPWVSQDLQQTTVFRMPPFQLPQGARTLTARWRPFYSTVENWRYRMYFERKNLPMVLW
jgi:uncharacterized protein